MSVQTAMSDGCVSGGGGGGGAGTKTYNVLSEEDHRFFEREGYVLIREAVPADNIARVKQQTWDFLGMDASDPDSWYREGHSGMVC
jgi:hypothetical protein